jgi:putative ABC transport system permease protein
MEGLLKDCRFGFRMLLKNPGMAAVAIVALMLGIGANSAIFSVVNAVLLRPLPYEQSDKLIFLSERSQVLEGMSISYPNFQDWRARNEVFEGIAVFRRQSLNLTGRTGPERLTGGLVSAELFPMLRVKPELGRVFTGDEDKPGAQPVAVLTDTLWQRRFGGDRAIIGQSITLNDKQYEVIGVMPEGFQFPTRAELWMPVGQESGNPSWAQRGNHPGLYGIARLKPGVTLEQARANMDSVAVQLEQQYPDSNVGNRVTVRPYLEQVVSDIRPALLVLLGAVGFVLLIACANVANLLLARAATRQKEISIRVALGAGRRRLVRQLLTESLILALVGGGLGLVLARIGVTLIVAAYPDSIPRSGSVGLDWTVVGFTALVAIGTGVVFGLVPALHSSKPDVNESLKDAARGSSGGVGGQLVRNVLVAFEVMLSLVLLIGAGLMLRSFYSLLNVDPGFKTESTLTFNVNLPPAKYKDNAQTIGFFRQALDRLKALPGVQAVGLSSGLPLGNNGNQT